MSEKLIIGYMKEGKKCKYKKRGKIQEKIIEIQNFLRFLSHQKEEKADGCGSAVGGL